MSCCCRHPGGPLRDIRASAGSLTASALPDALPIQALQREHLAQDPLRGIGCAAQIRSDAVADVAGVAALLRPQVEHGKREAFGKRADLAALLPLSEGEGLVIWNAAGRC